MQGVRKLAWALDGLIRVLLGAGALFVLFALAPLVGWLCDVGPWYPLLTLAAPGVSLAGCLCFFVGHFVVDTVLAHCWEWKVRKGTGKI